VLRCKKGTLVVTDERGNGIHWCPAPGMGTLDKQVDRGVASAYDEACARDAQLCEPATLEFIKKTERRGVEHRVRPAGGQPGAVARRDRRAVHADRQPVRRLEPGRDPLLNRYRQRAA
jgi:hypothetical protein